MIFPLFGWNIIKASETMSPLPSSYLSELCLYASSFTASMFCFVFAFFFFLSRISPPWNVLGIIGIIHLLSTTCHSCYNIAVIKYLNYTFCTYTHYITHSVISATSPLLSCPFSKLMFVLLPFLKTNSEHLFLMVGLHESETLDWTRSSIMTVKLQRLQQNKTWKQ